MHASLPNARALALLAAVVGVSCGISAPASALVWTLTGTFDDGGTVSSSSFFSWTVYDYLDSTGGSLLITTTPGKTLTGTTYSVPPSFPSGGSPPGPNGFIITNDYDQVLSIEFQNPLTTPGVDPIVLGAYSYECFSFSCPPGGTDFVDTRYFTGGEAVATTPLPAALPLFATGLGAMGLLGWRKKRKNATAFAAA
jgi:hypothetical protein